MGMCLSFDTIRLRGLAIRTCIKPRDDLIFARLYAKELRTIFSQSGTLIEQVELEKPIYFNLGRADLLQVQSSSTAIVGVIVTIELSI